MQVRLGTSARFINNMACGEAIKSECFCVRVGLIRCDQMSKTPTRSRGRLEAAITPSAIEVETVNVRLVNDGGSVHRHVHNASPMT